MIPISVTLPLCVGLGLIFLASSIPKLRYPQGFLLAVLDFRVLPSHLTRIFAELAPPLECLVGLLLLTGTAVRVASLVTGGLLLGFIYAIGVNVLRGRDLDCHCFGRAARRRIGWGALSQDSVMLSATIAVTQLAHGWIALEPWSIFHLLNPCHIGGVGGLIGCLVITTGTVVVLRYLARKGRRNWNVEISQYS